MTLYCVASNGMSFSFGHFLTTYSVKSSLMLSQQDGARLTSIYYGAQVKHGWSLHTIKPSQRFNKTIF